MRGQRELTHCPPLSCKSSSLARGFLRRARWRGKGSAVSARRSISATIGPWPTSLSGLPVSRLFLRSLQNMTERSVSISTSANVMIWRMNFVSLNCISQSGKRFLRKLGAFALSTSRS